MPVKPKSAEINVRRMAQRQGLTLHKSRRRDPFATDYGIIQLRGNRRRVVFEARSLEAIETYLTDPARLPAGAQIATEPEIINCATMEVAQGEQP